MSEASVSIRFNPFKATEKDFELFEGTITPPWNPLARILPQRPSFTLDPLFHAGVYYVQDSSAMYVGHVFRKALQRVQKSQGRPIRVLDLCAAPGGKTTDLAASLRQVYGDDFLLVSNEVMKARVGILSDNVAIWGDKNVTVTSVDPAAFARLRGFFDIIVADVPCSGEGMFRKDASAREQWSPEVVTLCAARQKRILADVWESLRTGGILIYSTCTYEKAENDDNLLWASQELGGKILPLENEYESWGVKATQYGLLLQDGVVPGEGQWVGYLEKESETNPVKADASALSSLHPLRQGVVKGEMKGTKLVPGADYALSLSYEGEYPSYEIDKLTALRFLHRDSLVLPDAPRGFVRLTYMGHALGFVNNLGTRCNNLHPQGRRILMDVETFRQ